MRALFGSGAGEGFQLQFFHGRGLPPRPSASARRSCTCSATAAASSAAPFLHLRSQRFFCPRRAPAQPARQRLPLPRRAFALLRRAKSSAERRSRAARSAMFTAAGRALPLRGCGDHAGRLAPRARSVCSSARPTRHWCVPRRQVFPVWRREFPALHRRIFRAAAASSKVSHARVRLWRLARRDSLFGVGARKCGCLCPAFAVLSAR